MGFWLKCQLQVGAWIKRRVRMAGLFQEFSLRQKHPEWIFPKECHCIERLKKGIQMMVDGHEPDVVRQTLSTEMNLTLERHDIGQKIFKAIGDSAPAMGMIGTLIGLVQMLSAMDDPKTIGPSMAVALLTTLYGAMIANMFALPIADKLALRSGEERLVKSMIIDSLAGIQEGRNPRVIEELLKTYLPGSKRETKEDSDEGD